MSWPPGVRIAVSLVVHFKEGAERSPLKGDDTPEMEPTPSSQSAVSVTWGWSRSTNTELGAVSGACLMFLTSLMFLTRPMRKRLSSVAARRLSGTLSLRVRSQLAATRHAPTDIGGFRFTAWSVNARRRRSGRQLMPFPGLRASGRSGGTAGLLVLGPG